MNERLKQIRKKLGYTQAEFSKLLGYTQPAYARLESKATPINDKHVTLICSRFNVSEHWFREGIGEMFNENNSFLEFQEDFNQLNEESQKFVLDMINTLLTRQDEED